ncbi:DUF2752 domain-containing protein [Flavobacteriaceae bacterium F89]|uniref:DUF2752 domain-containing protein n=1 Tax=Cerina litoralis TaxID=2874477 RepID=A0AAE3EYA2_9FLAO|nr:DUF2752 domain-containing protein [Cerina litoralis]MCG2461947.1 DUF2752 domain-containing protein [Cerina litoralis]
MIPCLNKKIFGVDCPGCGIQRSVALLLEGNFGEAFKMYPAIYTLIPLMAILLWDNFRPLKHANTIIITFTTLSIVLILINYILKFI